MGKAYLLIFITETQELISRRITWNLFIRSWIFDWLNNCLSFHSILLKLSPTANLWNARQGILFSNWVTSKSGDCMQLFHFLFMNPLKGRNCLVSPHGMIANQVFSFSSLCLIPSGLWAQTSSILMVHFFLLTMWDSSVKLRILIIDVNDSSTVFEIQDIFGNSDIYVSGNDSV